MYGHKWTRLKRIALRVDPTFFKFMENRLDDGRFFSESSYL